MKPSRLLEALEGAAQTLDVKVSYEMIRTGSPGGLCRVNGKYRVIIDRRAQVSERVGILADAIAQLPNDQIYLPPEVRQLIELRRPQPQL